MRGALLRNMAALYTNRNLNPTSIISHSHYSSKLRFFSSKNRSPNQDPKPKENKEASAIAVDDVSNKEFKVQIEDYLHNCNEEALPLIFQSILKRRLSGEHEDTDAELMEEFRMKPLDDVKDDEFDSDFDKAYGTDSDVENLYSARDIAINKMIFG